MICIIVNTCIKHDTQSRTTTCVKGLKFLLRSSMQFNFPSSSPSLNHNLDLNRKNIDQILDGSRTKRLRKRRWIDYSSRSSSYSTSSLMQCTWSSLQPTKIMPPIITGEEKISPSKSSRANSSTLSMLKSTLRT